MQEEGLTEGEPGPDSGRRPRRATAARAHIGLAVLILFLWVLLAGLFYLSMNHLQSGAFWAVFFCVAVVFSIGALSGDPNAKGARCDNSPLRLNQRQHFLIGIVGLIVLFLFVIILNSPIDLDVKWDIFYGATTGGIASMAVSVTYLEYIRIRLR